MRKGRWEVHRQYARFNGEPDFTWTHLHVAKHRFKFMAKIDKRLSDLGNPVIYRSKVCS